MGQISSTREINGTPEQVWEVVGDPNTYEKWMTLHQKWKSDVPADLGRGVQLTEVISMMGMPNTITWNVDDYEAPAKLAISGEGMAGVKIAITFTVTPTDAGAELGFTTSFEGQMIVGALGKAIEKQGAVEVEASLDKIAELLA